MLFDYVEHLTPEKDIRRKAWIANPINWRPADRKTAHCLERYSPKKCPVNKSDPYSIRKVSRVNSVPT